MPFQAPRRPKIYIAGLLDEWGEPMRQNSPHRRGLDARHCVVFADPAELVQLPGMPLSPKTAAGADTLPDQVAMHVDVASRSDLRTRIAETIERLAKDAKVPPGSRLPSTRTFANVLGVHRNTVRAAMDLLVERGVIEPVTNGRFRVAMPAPDGHGLTDNVAGLLWRAAELSIQHGETEADFTAIARTAFRTVLGEQRTRVYFIAPREAVPGVSADELADLLDHPVTPIGIDEAHAGPQSIFVATTEDANAVREHLDGQADVFTVGLSLDADLRFALAPLDAGSSVAVVAEDPAMLAAVQARVRRMRPDVRIDGYVGAPDDVDDDVRLVLAPVGAELEPYAARVARYRCRIADAELRLIRTRLGKDAAPVPAPSAVA